MKTSGQMPINHHLEGDAVTADAGSDANEGMLEEQAALMDADEAADDNDDEQLAGAECQTREDYLKKGEDLIRSLL